MKRHEPAVVDQDGRVLTERDIQMSRAFGIEVNQLTKEHKRVYQAAAYGAAYGMSGEQFQRWASRANGRTASR